MSQKDDLRHIKIVTADEVIPNIMFSDVEHSRYTDLEFVGLQIWNGALLLSEFVIHCGNSILHNKNVLELASGTGLVGVVAGMYCSHVTCTGTCLLCSMYCTITIVRYLLSNLKRRITNVRDLRQEKSAKCSLPAIILLAYLHKVQYQLCVVFRY